MASSTFLRKGDLEAIFEICISRNTFIIFSHLIDSLASSTILGWKLVFPQNLKHNSLLSFGFHCCHWEVQSHSNSKIFWGKCSFPFCKFLRYGLHLQCFQTWWCCVLESVYFHLHCWSYDGPFFFCKLTSFNSGKFNLVILLIIPQIFPPLLPGSSLFFLSGLWC